MTLLNRTGKKSPIGLIVGIIILVVLLVLPAFGSSNMLSILSLIFIYMAMGQMWNLMGTPASSPWGCRHLSVSAATAWPSSR